MNSKKLIFLVILVNTVLISASEIRKSPNYILAKAANRACYEGEDIDTVEKAIKEGADVNITDEIIFGDEGKGNTALMMAASNGHIDITKLLLKAKADVNKQNDDGVTALMMASSEGYLDIVQELINGNADVNIKDKNNNTALMYAVHKKILFAPESNHIETMVELLKAGADLNAQNNQGETVIDLASENLADGDSMVAILLAWPKKKQEMQKELSESLKNANLFADIPGIRDIISEYAI